MQAGPVIAIVGIGCRFPGGADSPARYWELLAEGRDATREAPADRLDVQALYDPDPGRPGRVYVRRGGYLDAIDAFDAAFFGISPREARRIDPQQRLLLEVAWEALEDAGQPASALAGTRAGVFVGIAGHDYGDLQSRPAGRELIDVHVTAGTATSIAANRISYALDLRGPSIAVDTACSSALTAVHLACRSIAAGECEVALAAAANALITPEPTIGFCKAAMLAPDGRCKPFDAAADGYGRGEGAAAVVLKPLARALADGDPIYAVVRATAINQDGRTPAISVPSPEAQEALLRDALQAAGLAPGDVQVVEAHGTGTPVGDPREALAIGRVLGSAAGRPLVIGSAKGNLGHLEAAAGLAGLIKAALALERRSVPPTINFARPNPAIDFAGLGLRVPTALEPWPAAAGTTAVAAVNSFGFGGANAHAILAEAPPAEAPPAAAPAEPPAEPSELPFLLSARDPAALRALAASCATWLRDGDAPAPDACFTAALRRDHHEHRLAAVGATAGELAGLLAAFAAGESRVGLVAGRAAPAAPRIAFVFSGMGPQWWGMGRELLRGEPVFAAAIDACDDALVPLAGWSLREELQRDADDSRVSEPFVAHVANLALQVGLAALLRAWGVVPDAVVGHSSGEMGAACVSGALALPDAVALAFHRGRLQQRATGSGTMLAAGIGVDEVPAALRGHERRVSLAAVNGPAAVTLAGDREALDAIAAGLARRGRPQRLLDVAVPYHGPQMDPLRDELLAALAPLRPRPPAIPLLSTVTGEWQNGRPVDAEYWWRNVRRPVQFAAAVQRLAADGFDVFVELSPQPVLAALVAGVAGDGATVLASLRRGAGERAMLLRALAALHVRGRPVDWAAVLGDGGRCVRMPTYAWQRERHWIPEPPQAPPPGADSGHPLLGRRLRVPRPAWEAQLGDARLEFLEGHRVEGVVTFPGAAHVELALAAAREVAGEDGPLALRDVTFERLLALPDRAAVALGCVAGERLEIHSAGPGDPDDWTLRASAQVAPAPAQPPSPLDLAAIRARCDEELDPDALYANLADRHGLGYDGAFRAVARVRRGSGEALADIALPAGIDAGAWQLHPALLDAAFQVVGATASEAGDGPLLPVAVDRVVVFARPGARCVAHVEVAGDGEALAVRVTLAADDGRVLARCDGLRLRRIGGGEGRDGWFCEERWEPAPRAQPPSIAAIAGRVAAFLDEHVAATGYHAYYEEVEPALDALALGHVRAALAELGGDPSRHVAARHERLLARLVALAGRRDEAPPPDAATLAARYPAYASAVELVDASGRRLAATLRGEEDAREWLVAGPSLRALTDLYASCPGFAVYGAAVAEAVAASVGARAPGTLRVLEVGAGTGGATARILDRLGAPAREYVFSDVSRFFLRRAHERFGDRPELRTAIIDLEDPPAAERGFDIVVAADVVHATADHGAALRALRALLAPGGVLVLMEAVRRSAWLDVVFGQLDGWWRADGEHPLRDAEGWRTLLEEAGFGDHTAVADRDDDPAHAVLLAAAPPASRSPGNWLVLTDRATGPELAAGLRERGDACALAWPGPGYVRFGADGFELDPADPDGWARLLADAGPLDAIVDLWALDAPDGDALVAFQRTACGGVVARCQALAAAGRTMPDTWLVTAGAQSVRDGEDVAAGQAPLWGLGRVLRTEQGARRCRLVDLAAAPGDADVAALLRELAEPAGDGTHEIALRDGERFARHVRPVALGDGARSTVRADPRRDAVAVAVARPGALESLVLRAAERTPPGPGEVEIRVVAAALNFRDVLVALGIGFAAGGADPARAPLGWECAGVVESCGEGVEGLAPGDEVVALAAGALASRVLARAVRAARVPAGISLEDAATLPVAFLTASWALERRAALQAGERVLIHCASGGVGLAAVQLARRAGADVLATAGSDAKRAYLRSLGIEHVFDSRSAAFAEGVRAATAGEGVDVVLNSLDGEAIGLGLGLLRPYGRFVEIGKRAIYEDGRLPLAPFRNNLSYIALDLQPLYADRPGTVGAMLRETVAGVQRGELVALPRHDFDLADVEPAFRLMAQARHIGKVVVTLRGGGYAVAPLRAGPLLRRDGAYVVTGGLGGFGLQVARWMVREGAGHVVLCSRSGRPREEDERALEELLASAAEVRVVRADVGDRAALARALDEARAMAPLRGVLHAAMVLDDGLLGTQDWARVEAVLAPKLAGAWNLHELTAADELDAFVMFSSISLLIGQVAQSGYAAGNAFLGALAAHRRACGLPALTVDWGTVTGAGYVARQPELELRLRRQGLGGIPAREACEVLGELMRRDIARIGVSRVDWSRAAAAPQGGPSPGTRPAPAPGGGGGLTRRLGELPVAERSAVVERYLLAAAARVLETTPDRVEPDRPLPDLGVDSLMAVELRTALRADLGVEVPIVELLERLSVRGLVAVVLEQLGG